MNRSTRGSKGHDVSFVVGITALLALFGWLVERGALPGFRRGEKPLFGTFSSRARAVLGVWLGTLAIFTLVLPLASVVARARQRGAGRAMIPYALVLVVQIATEAAFSRLFFPNIVAAIGLAYTPYRLVQLWRARRIMDSLGGAGGRFARALVSVGLVLWSANLVFLLVGALPRVVRGDQATRAGSMGRAERALYLVLNPAVRRVLGSRAHGLLSNGVALLTFVGHKSGRSYAVPVGYVLEGEHVICVTGRNWSNWWKNLRYGAPALVRLRGREHEGWAEIVEDEEAVARGLGAFLLKYRSTARRYGVRLDSDGRPESEDVEAAARRGGAIVVRVRVGGSRSPTSSS